MFRALLAAFFIAAAAAQSFSAIAVESSAGEPVVSAAAPFNAPRLNAFLAAQPLIRIAVPSAPGNGHQAIATIIAKRVRQLGFAGQYEFVYDHAVKEKLDLTLPGFDPSGPDAQDVASLGATAVPWDGAHSLVPEIPLSISAADQFGINIMNSVVSASIHPFGWSNPGLWHWVEERDEWFHVPLEPYKKHPLLFPTSMVDDPALFINENMRHSQRLREKINGLQALATVLDKVEILPAYGLSNYPDFVFKLLESIGIAQRRAPQLFRAGVVVPLFSWLNDMDVENLTGLLGGAPQLAGNLRSANIRDGGAVARELADLKKGNILLLHVGGVAQDVFDYFFVNQTLPGTVAGHNGQNFMRVQGLPYINTLGEEPFVPPKNLDRKIRNMIKVSQAGIWQSSSDVLAKFLVESKRPNSRVARTMARLRPTSDSDDKIALVLNEAVALYDRLSGRTPTNESQRPTENKAD